MSVGSGKLYVHIALTPTIVPYGVVYYTLPSKRACSDALCPMSYLRSCIYKEASKSTALRPINLLASRSELRQNTRPGWDGIFGVPGMQYV